ncbi:MAG TPA: signal peptide peptidase SppA [candidate division Zixibacteria bacterium]|jgi:protease IV|nr:signal peptide peptidase SppA [candidate division Zixibacteria bacterium]HBZ00859.1 signal peptide peptidase SppA [candidate division Zixibacteria bacterium]
MTKNRDKLIILIIVGAALVFFVGFSAVLFVVSQSASDMSFTPIGNKIALIDVTGVIEKSDDIIRQLKKYEDDSSIKALVLRIDSPGGGVAASQEIYEQLKKFKEKHKYIVVSMGAVAASGGYYIACAADTIFANPGTLTGSIGVIFSYPVVQALLDKVGVKMQVIKSGKLKDVGNFAREPSPEDIEMLQSVIDDTYDQFVNVVAEGRNLEPSYVKGLADGSVFTGRQAQEKGLVDKLGTLDDAIVKAGQMSDLGSNPRVIKERRINHTLLDDLIGKLGLEDVKSNIHLWPSLEYRYNY